MIHVLLVEDSPTDAKIIQQVLIRDANQSKWDITHVERLGEAIKLCNLQTSQQHSQFDIVILDLRLPDSTGLDTVKSFRSQVPWLPAIVLTGNNDEELGLQAMVEGAQDYLVKDEISTKHLLRAIRYAIERGQILNKIQESDINTRKALAREQELNEIKSKFFSMVSHEFRTPMSTIRSSVDLMQLYSDEISSEQNIRYLKRIENAIEQMLKLLDDILFIQRNEVGRVKFNPRPIDLVTFCQEIIDVMQLSVSQEHKIIFAASGDFSQAEMDEELLSCIFTNLLSNAVKYSPKNSDIWFTLNCQNDTVVFQIQDQGVGIPKNDQNRLFENFYRASNVSGIQGTGLGLAIVKRCVELHQGSIKIESEVGVGTTVVITFPLYSD